MNRTQESANVLSRKILEVAEGYSTDIRCAAMFSCLTLLLMEDSRSVGDKLFLLDMLNSGAKSAIAGNRVPEPIKLDEKLARFIITHSKGLPVSDMIIAVSSSLGALIGSNSETLAERLLVLNKVYDHIKNAIVKGSEALDAT